MNSSATRETIAPRWRRKRSASSVSSYSHGRIAGAGRFKIQITPRAARGPGIARPMASVYVPSSAVSGWPTEAPTTPAASLSPSVTTVASPPSALAATTWVARSVEREPATPTLDSRTCRSPACDSPLISIARSVRNDRSVYCRRTMSERLGVAEIGQMREKLDRLDQLHACFVPALEAEGEKRARSLGQVFPPQRVIGARLQPGIGDPADQRDPHDHRCRENASGHRGSLRPDLCAWVRGG